MKTYLKIGEAAAQLGVSPETMRDWHRKGVLIPDLTSCGKHRLYSQAQVNELHKRMSHGEDVVRPLQDDACLDVVLMVAVNGTTWSIPLTATIAQ